MPRRAPRLDLGADPGLPRELRQLLDHVAALGLRAGLRGPGGERSHGRVEAPADPLVCCRLGRNQRNADQGKGRAGGGRLQDVCAARVVAARLRRDLPPPRPPRPPRPPPQAFGPDCVLISLSRALSDFLPWKLWAFAADHDRSAADRDSNRSRQQRGGSRLKSVTTAARRIAIQIGHDRSAADRDSNRSRQQRGGSRLKSVTTAARRIAIQIGGRRGSITTTTDGAEGGRRRRRRLPICCWRRRRQQHLLLLVFGNRATKTVRRRRDR